ncbi:MAG TPA: membrane protein insertase YidC, partial [Verrucomicrobiae bacterium]|nr:membrane protein insertase YidC [Verrucomicrobiae bacterium]
MDRKSISVIVLCVVLLAVWNFVVVPKYWPYHPPPPSTNAVTSAESPTATNVNATSGSNVASVTANSATSAPPMQMEVNTNISEQLLVITNADARYTFSSYGGGLKLIELPGYPETIPSWRNKKAQAAGVASLNSYTPSPTLAVLGGSNVQGDGIFTLTRTATGVRAEKTLTNGLTIVKDFSPTTNFLVNATVSLENRSAQPLALPEQEWVVGTSTPMNADDRGIFDGLMWSDGGKPQDILGAREFSSRKMIFMSRIPPTEYRANQTNIVWAAVHNQYFALAMIASSDAAGVVMRPVILPRTTTGGELPAYSSNGYTAALIYPQTTLAAHQDLVRKFILYAGPKKYSLLAKVAQDLNNNLDALMNFGMFGIFSKALLLAMNFLHAALDIPYGWIIVLLTVLLRVIFWPLTAAGTRSMKRMQALQPQINALKEKYKDDAVKLQKKQMELWKEHKVNPMAGCLPSIIQLPVFWGFYRMIYYAIELRGAHFLWVADLSKPDTLFLIPGINFPFNLLPLLMVGVMVWQAHLTPPSPG